jgi:pilus assembly protein Flp/PilA
MRKRSSKLRIFDPSLAFQAKRIALLPRIIKDESGVTAIEYALIAAMIIVVAIAIIGSVGTNLSSTFSQVAAAL